MLAFDIETMGLKWELHDITCACAYDAERGIEEAFVFARGGDKEAFMRLLDEADRLCAFNGVRFDVPFIARRWQVPQARYSAWMEKLFDPFETCKQALGKTFSLNKLLALNSLTVKTSSGMEAVNMAREGRYDELADYCMHDTKMTHAVCAMERMHLPVQCRGAMFLRTAPARLELVKE